MKTGTQFKVKDYEGFKEAMKVYDFKNPRVADERFKELGYRYVTKFPTHIDISQRIEHYELIDNPVRTVFSPSGTTYYFDSVDVLEQSMFKNIETRNSVVDEDTGLHYVKEREEGVDWDNASETLEEFKKSGIPMSDFLMSSTGDVEFITQKEFMDKLNSNVAEDYEKGFSNIDKNATIENKIGDYDERESVVYNKLKGEEGLKTEEVGLRYNTGKRRWSLVDFEALEEMVKVLEFGAEKYDDHNWKKGMSVNEVSESLMRHMFAFLNGEDDDKESGFTHLGHVQCNAMFLSYIMKHKNQFDDRFNSKNKK